MAVVAPTPSASARTAAIVKAGVRMSRRQPKRMSWNSVSMPGLDGPVVLLVVGVERVLRDDEIGDRPAVDQVLLDDPLEHRRIAGPIPGAVRIDDRDRSALTDA